MNGRSALRLRAESYGCAPTELECEVRVYDRAARIRRAAGIGGALLGGAVLSVPVPGWHFVGVPGFLIGAVRLGLRRLRQERAITAVQGRCPACGAEQRFPVPPAASFPHTLACSACRAFLKLSDLR